MDVKGVTVYVSERKIPEAVPEGIAAALAAFRGRLQEIESKLQDSPRHEDWMRLRSEIHSTLALVQGIVVTGLSTLADDTEARMERAYKAAEYADGWCIVLSRYNHRDHLSACLWARPAEDGGVVLSLDVGGKDHERLAEPTVLHRATDFDSAYDWMLVHKDELEEKLQAAIDAHLPKAVEG